MNKTELLPQNRISWIDISKGILILSVFAGHMISSPNWLIHFIYSFHMPAFFFLSGYCFSAKRKFGAFILNKLKTVLLPLFTIGLTESLAVALLKNILEPGSVSWSKTLLAPFVQYGSELNLLWFLPAVFICSIVMYALVKLFKEKLIFMNLTAFILAVLVYAVVKICKLNFPWFADVSIIAMPFLTIGYTCKNKSLCDKLKKPLVFVVSFLLCTVIGTVNSTLFWPVEMKSRSFGNFPLFYIVAFLGCVMIASSSMLISKNRVLEYFGRNSLLLYAMEPIGYFTNFILKHFSGVYENNDALAVVFTSLAVIFTAIIGSIAAAIVNRYLPFIIGKKYKSR